VDWYERFGGNCHGLLQGIFRHINKIIRIMAVVIRGPGL
jgi:hypothetical protein